MHFRNLSPETRSLSLTTPPWRGARSTVDRSTGLRRPEFIRALLNDAAGPVGAMETDACLGMHCVCFAFRARALHLEHRRHDRRLPICISRKDKCCFGR
eukprot:7080444-Prymnesium_polylepis.1